MTCTLSPLPDGQGDPDGDVLYRGVGLALSAWEAFEEELAWVVAFVTGGRDLGPVRAYGSKTARTVRRDELKRLVDAFFAKGERDGDRQQLLSLLDDADTLAPRRNDIAHGRVLRFGPHMAVEPWKDIGKGDRGCWLVAPYYNAKRTRLAPDGQPPTISDYAYVAADLEGFAEAFRDLERRALGFSGMLHRVYLPTGGLVPP
jgi:hypothetical protein